MATIKFPFDHVNMMTAEEFRAKADQAGYDLPVSSDLRALREPCMAGGRRLENSMAVQPLEGLDAAENGAPSSLTLARYEKLAAQGAGILWVEATAVVPEGRDSLRQLWLHPGSADGFRQLTQTINTVAAAAGYQPPYKVIQLTHSGRCSVDASGAPAPQAAFTSPYLDSAMGMASIVTDEYLDQLQTRLEDAAGLAADAGFDAVELKLCHQYLFKELLCAYTRPGKYGGSQENRFRFALGAVDRIRSRLGSRIDIVVRLNAYDGIPWPYGWGMARSAACASCSSYPGACASCAVASNWMGNSKFVPAECVGCTSYPAACASCAVASNWMGNQQIAAGAPSNWPGNPAPLNISDKEKSSWQGNQSWQTISGSAPSNWPGNPAPLNISDKEKSSWQGNREVPVSAFSNWPGNPAPLNISDEERSSWQGNPNLRYVTGSAATNWAGNPSLNPDCVGSDLAGNAQAGPMAIDLTEVKELIRQLYARGIRVVNLTTTSPRFMPSGNGYLENFNAAAEVDPFAGVSALLHATKEIRGEMPADLKIVGTGLSWFGPFSANVAAGGIEQGWFDIAGFGRSVMADNDFVPSILRGSHPSRTSFCIGCDSCFQLFFAGLPTGCPVQHAAYKDLFQAALEQGRIRRDTNTIL